jgi:hypothetical protein
MDLYALQYKSILQNQTTPDKTFPKEVISHLSATTWLGSSGVIASLGRMKRSFATAFPFLAVA